MEGEREGGRDGWREGGKEEGYQDGWAKVGEEENAHLPLETYLHRRTPPLLPRCDACICSVPFGRRRGGVISKRRPHRTTLGN